MTCPIWVSSYWDAMNNLFTDGSGQGEDNWNDNDDNNGDNDDDDDWKHGRSVLFVSEGESRREANKPMLWALQELNNPKIWHLWMIIPLRETTTVEDMLIKKGYGWKMKSFGWM